MNRNDLDNFKNLKDQIKRLSKKIMFRRMVRDNIADLIPSDMELREDWYETRVRIRYKDDRSITADVFDKFVAKMSKKLRGNPSLYVTPDTLDASWYFRFPGTSITLDFSTNNSEACDVVEKKVERTEYELTGYCKALSEKQYFNAEL